MDQNKIDMCGVNQMGCPHRWAILEEYHNVIKYICKDCRITIIKIVEKNGKKTTKDRNPEGIN